MKRIVLAALLLAPLPVAGLDPAMADNIITITIVHDQGGTTQDGLALTPDDMKRFEDWVLATYKCTPVPPDTSCVAYSRTTAEQAWIKSLMTGTFDNVHNAEKAKLAADAVAGHTPITPTSGTAKKK